MGGYNLWQCQGVTSN